MTQPHGPDLHGLIAVEMADFHWSNDPDDREVQAMASRAMAVVEPEIQRLNQVRQTEAEMFDGMAAEWKAEIERLRKIETAAREMFHVIEDEFPSIHVMRWRAALTPPAESSSADD